MSQNEMICGFAIKTTALDEVVGDDKSDYIDDLHSDFDKKNLGSSQLMYDDSDCVCLVNLVNSDYDYCGDTGAIVTLDEMKKIDSAMRQFAMQSGLRLEGECIFFFKVWYNGCDMGTIFEV